MKFSLFVCYFSDYVILNHCYAVLFARRSEEDALVEDADKKKKDEMVSARELVMVEHYVQCCSSCASFNLSVSP